MKNKLSNRNVVARFIGPNIVILIMLIAALSVFSTGCGKGGSTKDAGKSTPYEVIMVINQVEPMVAEAFKTGDAIYMKKDGKKIGIIKRFEVEKSRNIIPTDDGRLVAAQSPIFKQVKLYLDADGYSNEAGIFLFGNRVLINSYETYVTPGIQFDATVFSIKKK